MTEERSGVGPAIPWSVRSRWAMTKAYRRWPGGASVVESWALYDRR